MKPALPATQKPLAQLTSKLLPPFGPVLLNWHFLPYSCQCVTVQLNNCNACKEHQVSRLGTGIRPAQQHKLAGIPTAAVLLSGCLQAARLALVLQLHHHPCSTPYRCLIALFSTADLACTEAPCCQQLVTLHTCGQWVF